MTRLSRFLLCALFLTAAVSCSRKATINAVLEQAPQKDIIVKLLDINRYQVLDTVRTDDAGKLSCKVSVQKGQPEFVYLFYGDVKVASLLLEAGDKVEVKADTLGNFSVTGSPESEKLSQLERSQSQVTARLRALSAEYASAPASEQPAIRQQMTREYVDYYRTCVRYVMENSHSLTCVPVLFQNLDENLPVFGQVTDAIHFQSVCDSLSSVYPDSKYVKALRKEAETRRDYMELDNRLKNADQINYPDIELPSIEGEKVKLSDLDSKVVLIQFWSSSQAEQKMFNLDVLKPLYDKYHSRGFDIYQVSLDVDKAAWASVLKKQQLPWTNVCDSRGTQSPYVGLYNLQNLPAMFILKDGSLVDGKIVDSKSLDKLLESLLK